MYNLLLFSQTKKIEIGLLGCFFVNMSKLVRKTERLPQKSDAMVVASSKLYVARVKMKIY